MPEKKLTLTFTDGNVITPGSIACPACMVSGGERCTVATETGRKPVNWVHLAREAALIQLGDEVGISVVEQ